ncbi:nicotinate-nucleotide--dimethylbenzimidazole phosphoribosyltransferase [Sodalis ligni]|uniref:Nicotinate-nucleotide--dimethylbenzimidazole phosphoribosyltransferase n=1 Tax=Sodalis ligni TaxID=2697027 RepID=A0A4R1NEK7_9GAMM|nr:nicotinate-nucleotide--dimethylbenzimidazole phosphoribosyltransferase [Sodalis ligni]QWA13715.1 nicotinate-nucleotide--dimethylbenzimidazole phosphoribosyltransferase [Sodalis ligni]TCL02580.1 nicotinate-nucleotide-dimethylbenzimidazole phosphoribosyltransferase [Sodalis ligni]
MNTLQQVIDAIRPLDTGAMAAAQQRLDGLLKPPGSLGRLEQLAVQLAGIMGDRPLQFDRKQIMVMIADHGVYEEGVAISPRIVTAIQAVNMVKGITGVCVLAANAGAQVTAVDLGIDSDLPLPGLIDRRMGRGSGNIAAGPAMSRDEAEKVLEIGAALVSEHASRGVSLFGVGELGMANTTPAAALVSVLAGVPAGDVVGRGANLPVALLQHKIDVVERAIAVNRPDPRDGVDTLAKVGGYDLGGMAGVMLGAAAEGLPVILDGFLSYAAALVACRIAPLARAYLIPSHLSAEKGAKIALAQLDLRPYLDLEMRLGEGSGAALAMNLVDAACAMYHNMGTLSASEIELPAK